MTMSGPTLSPRLERLKVQGADRFCAPTSTPFQSLEALVSIQNSIDEWIRKIEEKEHPDPVTRVVTNVCRQFCVTREALFSRGRTAHLALARQVAMVLVRKLTGWSSTQVGALFARDHGTVLHAEQAVANAVDTDRHVQFQVMELCRRLGAKL